jgi:L-ascorbate metabolism protein UlaG (beta-lactamase superfamily)
MSTATPRRRVARVAARAFVVVVVVVAAGFCFRRALLPAIGADAAHARAALLAAQPNFVDGQLRNDLPLDESLAAVLGAIGGDRAAGARPDTPLQLVAAPPPAEVGDLAAQWLGHSTVVLDVDGVRVLIDPMWGRFASPLPGVGPERYLAPPLALADVGAVDVVVISHDHYDHLDRAAVEELGARGARFVVPAGIGAHLERWGVPVAHVEELGWWQEVDVDGVRVVCTPARHFSGRELTDRFATLWSGWAFVGPRHRVAYTGDGGMGPHFAAIGDRLGPFDLTLAEAGSYDPAWPDVHLGPEQALLAHRALRGRHLLPVHWATFVMGNHGWVEPGERLLAAARPEDGLLLPAPGQRLDLTIDDLTPRRWWPDAPWRTAAQAPIHSSKLDRASP